MPKKKKLNKPPKPGMKRFEVKQRTFNGKIERAIFVDGEHFDWEVDQKSLEWALQQGPEMFAVVQRDIQRHFLESLSEFCHKDITFVEFMQATQTGWI
jgi:hypothetical protein